MAAQGLLLPAGAGMSAPASARTEGPGLGLLGHGEELSAQEGAGTRRRGHQAEARQVPGPGVPARSRGSSGCRVCSAAGTVLGVAGAACPSPRRGSFPYKEFGWSPSSGSRARLRLPHSSQPRPCRGRCCPGPALTENPASPPAVGFKVGGCVSLLFLGCDGWAEGCGVLLFRWGAGRHCGMRMPASLRMRMEERRSPPCCC